MLVDADVANSVVVSVKPLVMYVLVSTTSLRLSETMMYDYKYWLCNVKRYKESILSYIQYFNNNYIITIM